MLHCMRLIGQAERALELMVARAKSRVAFGKTLAEQGVVMDQIASSRSEIEQSRLLVLKAAHMMDTVGNKVARKEIAMIKVVVPNMAARVIDRAIQVHGGGGVSSDFPLSYAYANARYLRLADGPDEVHNMTIAKLELKDKNKVMFISAERFMYQFVKSIKSNDMVKFKEYFRNTDILLIDDIQFMNGKEAMQEEFFHTFNALFDKGSQIIVSADRPPNKLSRIQDRIKSRFSGGLVVDIQNPDYELRSKIIKSKTEELKLFYSNQVHINEEIQKFISTEVRTSIRELVGALNRIVSFSRIYNKIPNLSEVRVILKDLLNLSENKVTIDTIQTIVCKFFKISKNEMLSPRRSRYLVRPRQTAIYLAKMLTSKSLPEIGRAFSNRDHTTVIHSVKTIEKLRKEDNELNINIDSLKNKILYNQDNEI